MLLPSAKIMPATAALAPAAPPSSTPSRRWSMPNAAATVRSCANARMPRPVNVRCSRRCPPPTSRTAATNANSVAVGSARLPSRIDPVAYGLSCGDIRRKSALHTSVASWMVMMRRPKLTSSEPNSTMRSRS